MAKEGTWLTTVDFAKSTKAPKSVVSEMSVDSAKSIKAPKPVVSELCKEEYSWACEK